MLLTDGEFEEVASFFARRFPPPEPPRNDVTEHVGWVNALEHAQARGTLHRLAADLAAKDPSDRNLQAICALMTRPERRWPGPVAFAAGSVAGAGVLACLLVAGGAAYVALGTEPAGVAAATAEEIEILTESSFPAEAPAEPAEPAVAALSVRSAAMVVPVEPMTPTKGSESVSPPAKVRPLSNRCWRGEGELVGYWYGGKSLIGQVGDVVTMEQSMYVRADYPDHRNHYDTKSPVQCVLRKGERIKLTKAPVLVPGNSYWMPLTSGDVLEETARVSGPLSAVSHPL